MVKFRPNSSVDFRAHGILIVILIGGDIKNFDRQNIHEPAAIGFVFREEYFTSVLR